MVYYDQQPPTKKEPSGCLDALLIMRALFGLLMWPLIAIVVIVGDLVAIVAAFSVYPALALVPLALTAVAVFAYVRWEQQHFRPPDV